MPRNTVTEQIYHITIRNLGIASSPCFFLSPQGGHGSRKILMDFHPYGYETSIFTLGAPHEEVWGRQTKLYPGFTLGKLAQPSPGITILRDSHIVLSKKSQWCPPELPYRAGHEIRAFQASETIFCCRITQYHSQGFPQTTSRKLIKIYRNMQIVSVRGTLTLQYLK